MDSKDTEGMTDEFLQSRGFARDAEFFDTLSEMNDPDEDEWEDDSWMFDIIRFIESPSDDIRVILKRIEETFFHPPEDIWIGDKKVPDHDWINKNPSWLIVR